MDSVLIFPILTAVFYYLGARAMLTEPLWRQYPPRLDRFMNCAACSGFWYGLGLGIFGHVLDVPFLGATSWSTPFAVALMSIWWTPVLAAVMERALHALDTPDDTANPDA